MNSNTTKTKKIDHLTPEQEALMPHYVDKWINVGTDTTNVSLEETQEIVRDFRELINLRADVPLVIAKNPIESWVKCCLYELGVELEDLDNETEKVFNKTSSYSIPQASLPYNTNLLAYVFSFYDYMFNVVGVKIEEDLLAKYKVWERTSKLFAIYPLEGLTVVCEKPTAVTLNENNVLHCDGGPALEFAGPGDFKIYALNGVRVPEYLALTPSHKLDLKDYAKETTADVKAEFVRKAGIERFAEMGKLLDTYTNYDQEDHPFWWQSEYELWDMRVLFPSLNSAPYLKMKNFTTGVWHMEGVSPNCKTVKAALKERFGGRDMKIVAAA